MSALVIDGKKIAQLIKDELKLEVATMKEKGQNPTLAVVLVGLDPASQVYVRNKKLACEYVGIRSQSFELEAETTQEALLALITKLNEDKEVHGILVQLPLPKHIDEDAIIMAISPDKDVDGFHPVSVGRLSIGQPKFVSCTPAGVIEMLKRSDIDIVGKNCVVVGRSNIVGKPVSMLLLQEHGTVTITHSRTKNLAKVCQGADILVAAIGKANFITADFVKPGATVIDVGINRTDDGKLCGDVDYKACEDVAGAITPVPGGVGPMTIAMLMKNCVKAAKEATFE